VLAVQKHQHVDGPNDGALVVHVAGNEKRIRMKDLLKHQLDGWVIM